MKHLSLYSCHLRSSGGLFFFFKFFSSFNTLVSASLLCYITSTVYYAVWKMQKAWIDIMIMCCDQCLCLYLYNHGAYSFNELQLRNVFWCFFFFRVCFTLSAVLNFPSSVTTSTTTSSWQSIWIPYKRWVVRRTNHQFHCTSSSVQYNLWFLWSKKLFF